MRIKKFDQVLHDKYDPPAREAITKWAKKSWGIDCLGNPDRYGIDLIAYRDGVQVGYIEVEVRTWNPCPFDTIHVPKRKLEMLELPNALFFALTEDLSHAYWIKGSEVFAYKTVEVKKNSPVVNEEMSLSFYKELIYYIATITANVEKFMYTPEKKLAIAKALGSQGHLVENQIDKLKFVQDKLESHGTLKDLGLKEAVNEVVKGLKYQNLLISQFKEELNA